MGEGRQWKRKRRRGKVTVAKNLESAAEDVEGATAVVAAVARNEKVEAVVGNQKIHWS